MKRQDDLIGKTITGIMAVPTEADGPLKIWMLQFSDGTHVEFVSPGARRTLERLAGKDRASGARPTADGAASLRKRGRQTRSKSAPEPAASERFTHPQLALNVA